MIKINALLPKKYKLKAKKNVYEDATPYFLTKDLKQFFSLPNAFWQNLRNVWYSNRNKIHNKIKLHDFMTVDHLIDIELYFQIGMSLYYIKLLNMLKNILIIDLHHI